MKASVATFLLSFRCLSILWCGNLEESNFNFRSDDEWKGFGLLTFIVHRTGFMLMGYK